jgi:hypothetical protein
MVHRRRPDLIRDPAGVLVALGACRKTMIETMKAVKPMGVMYQGLSMVVAAIDALATLLVGREGYFWATGSSPMPATSPDSSSATSHHPETIDGVTRLEREEGL